MKVLVLGVFAYGSTNISQADAFEEAGCDVTRFDFLRGNIVTSQNIIDELVGVLYRVQPDVTFISKGFSIPEGIVQLANQFGKTVMWYMDPLNSNFNEDMLRKLKHATIGCFALQEPFWEAKKLREDLFLVPEGYDPAVDKPFEVEQDLDVTFIGELRNDRHRYHHAVPFKIIDGVYGTDHAKTVGRSKINLNFTEGGPSDRVYKVLAAGGFLLTQPWPDMEKIFVPGVDLDIFDTPEELKEKIVQYTMTKPEHRKKIAAQGVQTVQQFSRHEFAKKVLKILEEY